MACLAHTLFLLEVFSEGLSEMIRTQDPVIAMVGEEACFTCQLTKSQNVLQVTWQKIFPGGTEDVATSNKRFGIKINPPFQGKVKFKDTGLHNSTIVVRNVTKADACCYRCLFNAYPGGAIYKKTCLTVYEQPEPILRIIKPNGTELMVVSCSAVSRPAPTVTLQVPEHVGSSNNSTVHVTNANGTITVTSTVTLERFCSNGTQVHCEVRSYSGVVKQMSSVIYSNNQAPFCDVFEKSEAYQSDFIMVMLLSVAAFISAIIMIGLGLVFRLKQKQPRLTNDPDMKQTPQTMIQETREPLVPQEHSTEDQAS